MTRPAGATLASVAPSATRSDDLAAFDATLDHGGTSGATHVVTDDAEITVDLSSPADLALFTGTTPITLLTSGTDASTGPGAPDADSELLSAAGATVTVTYTYVTDTRPPDPPTITSSPGAFTADPNPIITFTTEAGATTECRLVTPTVANLWGACTSPWTADLNSDDDGPYTFSVRAVDGAGNVGEPERRTFTLDRISPATPTFTSTPPAVSMSARPVWAFSLEAGATGRCSLDGAPLVLCPSPFAPDLTAAADGPHTLVVLAVDAAANQSPPASHTYLLDRAAPAPPTITIPAPSPSNDPTPTWTFELAADAVGATCSVDGGPYQSCSSPYTANLSPPPGADEVTHTLDVRNHDLAGNHSPATTSSYLLDRLAPAPPAITGPGSPSNGLTPVWTITTEAGATTECRLNAGAWTPCIGSFTTTFGPGSDGVHVLTVRATDQAGNTGTEATATYVLDTTAPVRPVITVAPADPSNSPLPSWSFTVEPLAAASCSINAGSWLPCGSPWTVDLTAAADGPHTLSVRATDAAGNVGPVETSTFTLDRAAPQTPVITDGPASPGSASTVTWTFQTPAGATATCRVDLGPALPCVDSWTESLTTDGTHHLRVQAKDAAGNPSALAVATYVLDTVAPVPPTITKAPASPSNVSTPQWRFTLERRSGGECSVDAGPWVPCASSFSADLSTAGDGPHAFAVRSTDAAGNISETTLDTFVLDRTAPSAPTVVSGPDPSSSDDTPSWSFEVEPGATAHCRVDDGPWAPCDGVLTADLAGAADGTHALEIRAVDAVGNVGPITVAAYDLDRVAPGTATFTTEPLSPGNDTFPVWTFTHEPGTTAWCSLDDATAVACPGIFAGALDGEEGEHLLTIVVVDPAGNRSAEVTVTYTLDTTAPVLPALIAPDSPGNDPTPEWSITVEDGSVAECSLDGGPAEACGALFSVDLTGLDGHHWLTVLARDAAGNASPGTTSSYELDTVAPAAPVLTHTPDAAAWVWRFSLEPGTHAECSVDGVPWSACASGLAGGTPDRVVRFEVRAVDEASNRSSVTGATVTPTLGTGPVTPPPPPPPPPLPPAGGGGSVTPDPEPSPLGPPPVEAEPEVVARPVGEGLAPGPGLVSSRRDPMVRNPDNRLSNVVADLLQTAAETTTIPMLVLMVVLVFVAVQNRIDRRDPKLANAPARDEPEYREFT